MPLRGGLPSLIGGAAAALLFLSPFLNPVLGQMLAVMAPLPLQWVVLTYGHHQGRLSTALACFLLSAAAVCGLLTPLDLINVLLGFLLLIGLPSIILAEAYMTAHQTGSKKLVWFPVETLTFMAIGWSLGLLALAFVLAPMLTGEPLLDTLQTALHPLADQVAAQFAPMADQVPAELTNSDQIAQRLAVRAPAAIVLVFSLMYLSNLFFAHALLLRKHGCIRPWPSFCTFRLSPWSGAAFGLALALFLMQAQFALGPVGSSLLLALLIALAIPLALQGMAVIHTFVRKRLAKPVAIGIYGVLFVALIALAVPTGVVLTLLGMADQAVDLRGKINPDEPHM